MKFSFSAVVAIVIFTVSTTLTAGWFIWSIKSDVAVHATRIDYIEKAFSESKTQLWSAIERRDEGQPKKGGER